MDRQDTYRTILLIAIITAIMGSLLIWGIIYSRKPPAVVSPPVRSEEPKTAGSSDNCEEEVTDRNSVVLKKPVIYLYGYDDTSAKVTLNLNGTIEMAYPEPEFLSGTTAEWEIEGLDDGVLLCNGKDYRYLFWEGDTNGTWTFTKGFCVAGNETQSFLEDELQSLGLNSQEIADFITYWVPQMKDNPYNVISFQTKAYTDKAKLTVEPKADTVLRIFMAWYPSQTMVTLPAQKFSVPARKGKTLVEWGGAMLSSTQSTGLLDETMTQSTATPQQVPVQAPVSTDPYAQYGVYAECAKAWDSTAALKCGQTWAQLDAGTRSAAYGHWLGHGTSGW